jgi:hypothetical protein
LTRPSTSKTFPFASNFMGSAKMVLKKLRAAVVSAAPGFLLKAV